MINQFKKSIREYAELCNMEIKSMRKSKKFDDVVFVYGYNGEVASLSLLDGNWRRELHKGFKKPFPKIVRTFYKDGEPVGKETYIYI